MITGYKELLTKILLKKAKGYSFKEKVDEYAVIEGKKQLVKTKVTTKRVQPDILAVRALLELDGDVDITQMSDEQLQVEKLRLLRLLKTCDDTQKPSEQDSDSDD